MNPPFPDSPQQRKAIAYALVVLAAVILIAVLKTSGFIIALILAGVAWLMVNSRPDASEHKALRSSIRLSAEDIADVMQQYEDFRESADIDSVTDRTLHRPALMDTDCDHPAVEAFHYQYSSARRYLRRLEAKLNNPQLDTNELENLLKTTDHRAAEIRECWVEARRAAYRLGPNYKDDSGER
ncbi:hypothetical protein [Corynebacterium endometrii]|uniref:Uncharacterized protein n=1 Tax=Corynebacterium endometrii TaxID=2488819 RepID=A0A4V1CEM5_9CORY|nr:hypothetical protein [Corynebacterium endometrii]QCB28628.1 hypothetical protein CENDO_06770 [Corynebacterium endometrii]